jgi:hypothetical protein
MRPRFTIRTLLILTAIVAVGCWWFVRPTMLAGQFMRVFESEDYAAADRLIGNPKRAVQSKFDDFHQLGRFNSAHCALVPPKWVDLLCGRRIIRLSVCYVDTRPFAPAGDEVEPASTRRHTVDVNFMDHRIVATPLGLSIQPERPRGS